MTHTRLLASSLLFALSAFAQADVLINEIMHHPSSENPAEEYVELYNSGGAPVALAGWQFTSGVTFTFPAVSIPAGEYLVVAASSPAFAAKYPAVTNFVAGWTGQLSNSSNTITLRDALSVKVDEVDYADDGDWAVRVRQDPPDFGHRGWKWKSDADGFGKSLELINVLFDNSAGQNWAASATAEGTPGGANSVAASDIAPVISDAEHFPLVPSSTQSVTVTCRVVDDHATAMTVELHHRLDGAALFTTDTMFDDGAHGDALAGDGVFGALLGPEANGTIVEFYFTATDAATNTRTWPATARNYTGAFVQRCNCLYQVHNSVYAGAQPLYRMVMLAADRSELSDINTDTGTPPFPFNPNEDPDQTHSHARFNATWISTDGTGAELRYLTGVRNRGNGSRTATIPNFNVQFANADMWNGLAALNLNSQNTPYQLLGSALYRKAGLAMAEARAVQIRVNNVNLASGTGAPTYGFYVCNEFLDSDFAEHHFPLDSSGNIYRAQRLATGSTAGGTDLDGANLEMIVPAAGETLSLVDLYKLNYRKETNVSEDNWSDLIALTTALAKGHNGGTPTSPTSYDGDYLTSVAATADVAQWMRWFAVNAFADNEETNLSNGDGDDYTIYFGKTDPRARLIAYDLDTILGRSATSNDATHGIFRMTDSPGGAPTPVNPLMKHPNYAPLYFGELKRLLDGPFAPAQFGVLCDQVLAGLAPGSVITAMKTFNATRHAHIASLAPLAISVTDSQETGGAALTPLNGYPRTLNPACRLIGVAHAVTTRSVKVNGVLATWSAWQARWTANNIALTPGINRVLIQSFDGTGAETERLNFDVWFDDLDQVTAPAAIAADTTWTAAGGPYRVSADMTINAGATLSIEAGATVWLGSSTTGVDVFVNSGGRIVAVGTETSPIRFMRPPGATYQWAGFDVNGAVGSPMSIFRHCTFEQSSSYAIDVNAGDVEIDHCAFSPTCVDYVSLDGASFLISNCIFPSPGTAGEVVHGSGGVRSDGRAIVRDCFFGAQRGYNDVFDFTGGNRPGPIFQFINNVCVGSDDDILDLDSTDAWVEGNIMMHVHRVGTPDSASAVSGGSDNADNSHVTVVGNLIFDVDQACTGKQNNFYTFLNNTVVDQNGRGSDDTEDFLATNDPQFIVGVLNFADDGTTSGVGMYAEGNIIHSARALVRNYTGAQAVTWNNNLLPPGATWSGPGSGNVSIDPLLNDIFVDATTGASNIPTPTEANFRYLVPKIRAQFGLDACSPARGTGPNGTDKGGIRPFGVSLGGAPTGTTNATSATVVVGTRMTGSGIPATAAAFPQGSGWTHYKWRLDGGAWSAETVNNAPIVLAGLANGPHTLEVVGKNDARYFQDDAAFGASGRIASATWTVDTAFTPPAPAPLVRIHEVLAQNTETVNFGTAFPDLIELHNSGSAPAVLDGWGLTDNAALPYKYTIPNATTLAPGAYLTIYASGAGAVPQPKTGFGLKAEGDTLALTRSAAAGGGVADSIPFGNQLADTSIGRCADGSWALCRPTFGSANVLANTGPLTALRINEWLAAAAALAGQDFIELHNTAPAPVNIGLGYLTDNPSDWPNRHQIRQLTFIAPGGYISFKADSDPGQGPDHLNFKLSALQGEIGLFDPALVLLDNVVYGPQRTDISEGRTPNGASTAAFFTQPTPAGPNPAVAGGNSVSTINLMTATHGWRYRQNATAAPPDDSLARTFTASAYDDTEAGLGWLPASGSAAQLLYLEDNALANAEGFAKTTLLTGFDANSPYQTYYFRTHFTYNGPLTGVTFSAKIMCDDGANIYINGNPVPIRVRMNEGATGFADRSPTNVGNAVVETISIPAASIVLGDNVIAVSVHQEGTAAQSATTGSSDIVWGMKLDATITTSGSAISLVLNEVLPINATLQNPDSSFAGWIELHNTGVLAFDASDMSLSNDVALPRKFVFANGTSIPAGGNLIVQCNPLAAPNATNTGWALAGDGGTVGLYHKLANGGGLHDSLSYGRQIPDFSLGRTPHGSGPWALCVPTRDALNSAAAIGQLTDVKLNEWLVTGADFLELFNIGAMPVALGGNYLTDTLTNKTKHLIPALSFIGGSGGARWQNWIANNNNTGTPAHVNFALESGDALGLFTSAGFTLDSTPLLGTPAASQSAGKFPDGTGPILALTPTPSAANVQSLADTDGDSIPDAWEIANGLNPNDPLDAALDRDGDGKSSLAEYLAGTDPNNPLSVLTSSIAKSLGQTVIRFTAATNKGYTIQFKNTLLDLTWQKLTDIAADPSVRGLEIPDPAASGFPTRFYRVVTPVQP